MFDLDRITASNLQSTLDDAHAISERCLWVLYRDLSIKRQDLRQALDAAFLDHAHFLEDSDIPGLRGAANLAIRRSKSNQLKSKVAAEWGDDLCGLTLCNPATDQYAILMPCASMEGRVRASLFDERGFISHITRDSYTCVISEIADQGFIEESPNALDLLSKKRSFQEGNEFWAQHQPTKTR